MLSGIGSAFAAEAKVKTFIYKYNLAAGADSVQISLPARIPVSLAGNCLTPGFRGVAQATLQSLPTGFVEWTGLETTSPSSITEGYSKSSGTHILYLDYNHEVDVQVVSSTQIKVHNGSTEARRGQITLTYSE